MGKDWVIGQKEMLNHFESTHKTHRKQPSSTENCNYFVHSFNNYILSACLGRHYFKPGRYNSE